ncbi:hypothetical protein A6F68_02635 [Tsuneonella dongtanensis]|uniref:Uncharacterized protein n=1 Tax=Tsuneonella dongtanensis TaxID=692370 RepID=A0A1B2AG61_9SPHN|nr:hypothetical protein [Tsuneonella dongtanensis]ANY21129.1 hypothetical protein A6F68_02635 [Tsuneonella dongtanensis]
MRILPIVSPLLLLLCGATSPPDARLPDGYWTNEEDRYFTADSGGPSLDWTGIEVSGGQWRRVDAYRAPKGEWAPLPVPRLTRDSDGRWMMPSASGPATELRRGQEFTCWMAIPKFAKKPDGSDDLVFASKMSVHDQGGRVTAGGGDSGAPEVIFRLRQVVWPAPSTNKPSLVLYVIKPDAPEKAVSYSWADPSAKLIGINLRWVQGSCSRAD